MLTEAMSSIQGLTLFDADSVLVPEDNRYLKKQYIDLSGAVVGRDSSGRIQDIRSYARGKATGRWFTIDNTRHVIAQIVFDSTTATGQYKEWDASGQLTAQGPIEWDPSAFTRIFRSMDDGLHERFYPTGTMRQSLE